MSGSFALSLSVMVAWSRAAFRSSLRIDKATFLVLLLLLDSSGSRVGWWEECWAMESTGTLLFHLWKQVSIHQLQSRWIE